MDAALRYINRELSWLEFNQRVLNQADDPSIPLLERLKFLAITASNLDEFTAVRVGSLMLLVDEGSMHPDPAGLLPRDQLRLLRDRIREFTHRQYRCFLEDLEPALSKAGLKRLLAAGLSEKQAKVVEQLFDRELFPIFSPMAVSTETEFPLLANQTLNVCVRLAPDDAPRFAVIPFGRGAKRFLTLPGEVGYSYILLEDVVRLFVSKYFPGEAIRECVPFRDHAQRRRGIPRGSRLGPDVRDAGDSRRAQGKRLRPAGIVRRGVPRNAGLPADVSGTRR